MAEIEVKLADPKKIVWDQGTGLTITGTASVKVEETPFIFSKLAEGSLVKADRQPNHRKPGKKKRENFYQGVG